MMLKQKDYSKAQSLVEYALLLGIVGLALVSMQVYMRRGLQAVVKGSADQLGSQQGTSVEINFRRQGSSVSVSNVSTSGSVATQVSSGGAQTKDTRIKSSITGSTTSVYQQ